MIYFEGGDYFWFDAAALMKELIKEGSGLNF
jgi:hypothetical protein